MVSVITRQEGFEGNPQLSFVSCHGVRHHLFTVLFILRVINGK